MPPLLRLGAPGGGKDDKDKDRSRNDVLEKLDKRASDSLASFVDLEKKKKHEEEKEFKRIQRDREKMAEAEKKLKRAQERAAIELKHLQQLGAGKGVAIAGAKESTSSSSSSSALKLQPGKIFLKHPTLTSIMMFTLGILYLSCGAATISSIDVYTNKYSTDKKIDIKVARNLTDTATSNCTVIVVLGVIQMLAGIALGAMVFNKVGQPLVSEKMFGPASTILFLFIVLLNVVPTGFMTAIATTPWYSELENSPPTVLLITGWTSTILLVAYFLFHATEVRNALAEKAGVKAAGVSSAAKAAAAAARK